MQAKRITVEPGVQACHSRACKINEGRKCNCAPTFQAWVRDRTSGRRLYRRCDTRAEARNWRQDALVAVRKGTMRAPAPTLLQEAGDALITGMRNGTIRNRSGDSYKPATIRSYDTALRLRILPRFGKARLSALRRADVQDFADALIASGLSASTVTNSLDPLRVIFRRAIRREEVTLDPTDGLELPAVRGRRDRIAGPTEVAALLDALSDRERALWATAYYAGLRRGELQELRWSDVQDLVADDRTAVIAVARAWDDEARVVIATKTYAGNRTVPVLAALKKELIAHKLRTGRGDDDLVFGRTVSERFVPSTVRNRALKVWQAAGLEAITLHELRHSCASLLIDAGVNDKVLSSVMGHASIAITYDRYGHLMPDSLSEAADKVNARLARH